MVNTIHGFSGAVILPGLPGLPLEVPSPSLTRIVPRSSTNIATVYHGIDVAELPPGPGGDSLVTFGRIHPDKGTSRRSPSLGSAVDAGDLRPGCTTASTSRSAYGPRSTAGR